MDLLLPTIGFGLVTASILALASVGFTLQFSVTGVVNFAFGDLMTVGAYVAWMVNTGLHWNIWVGAVAGMLFLAVASVAMNRLLLQPFIRKRTDLFGLLIVTFAFGLILENALQSIFGPNFQSYNYAPSSSVGFLGMTFTVNQLIIIALAVIVMLLVHGLLRYTKIGKAMRAMADDPALARACGIKVARITDLAWLISGALAGLAGFVLVLNTAAFAPSTGEGFLLVIVAAAVLGGVGRPYGAMVGALIVGLVTEVSVIFIPAEDKSVAAFVILVLVLLLRPQGIITAARG
jgi:branched-chain amino acid transport system permease protein/neutral amino acid transport system permease protein